MKEAKAAGVDEIPAEMLKSFGEKAIQELCDICKGMYEEKKWPDDCTSTDIIPLPKKNNAVNCSDYRTISLICHASKIMLRVLTKRIEAKQNICWDVINLDSGKVVEQRCSWSTDDTV